MRERHWLFRVADGGDNAHSSHWQTWASTGTTNDVTVTLQRELGDELEKWLTKHAFFASSTLERRYIR